MRTHYRIADVARRTGFNPSTLRYYEDIGLVPASARSETGYRLYDDAAIARLRFITRAKQLGCTLEEITDLVRAWDGERCAPVAERLGALVDTKRADTADRIAELRTFTLQLEQAAAALRQEDNDEACADDCACMGATAPPISCTLERTELPQRLNDWRALLAHVATREDIAGGVRVRFGSSADAAAVARLAQAEQGCCAFFSFTLTIAGRGVALEVTAPEHAQPLVASLFAA